MEIAISYWGTEPLELEDRDREQNEPPTIQGEMVIDSLDCLDPHRSTWLDGIHLRILREVLKGLSEPHSIAYHQPLSNGGS